MKYSTAELEGVLLDAAVAKAEGFVLRRHPGGFDLYCRPDDATFFDAQQIGHWLTWSACGPIIEREQIELERPNHHLPGHQAGGSWCAEVRPQYSYGDIVESDGGGEGPTPLVAAMRAYVFSKLRHEVELP